MLFIQNKNDVEFNEFGISKIKFEKEPQLFQPGFFFLKYVSFYYAKKNI